MDSLVVAAAALALIALAFWFSRRSRVSDSSMSTATAIYTQTATGSWPAEPGGVYTCPPASSSVNYCVLPTEAAAQAQCTGDPACLGYVYYGNSDTFGYQLFAQPGTITGAGYASAVTMTKSS